MALLVKVDGSQKSVEVPKDDTSLKFLQDAVGGFIEYVPVINLRYKGQYQAAFCDEEGKLKGSPINKVATVMAGRDGVTDPDIVDPLCGDVLFFAEGEVD